MSRTRSEKIDDAISTPGYMEAISIFGLSLSTILYENGISRRQFCLRHGISESYMSLVLRGKRIPSLLWMVQVATHLTEPLNEMLDPWIDRGESSPLNQ